MECNSNMFSSISNETDTKDRSPCTKMGFLLSSFLPGFIEQAIFDKFTFGRLIIVCTVILRVLNALKYEVALFHQLFEALIGNGAIDHKQLPPPVSFTELSVGLFIRSLTLNIR